jgi:hypothetical protein
VNLPTYTGMAEAQVARVCALIAGHAKT